MIKSNNQLNNQLYNQFTYNLADPSDEQINIINQFQTHNLIVDSVAGSGKTTSILHLAKSNLAHNILCLTYNARLKFETREKVCYLGLTNIEIHSYHAFAVKYYTSQAINDVGMKNFIKNNTKPSKPFTYDILIIDECQDMTPLYYELICKLLKDSNNNTHICLLGDQYQSIYEFNKADQRYITMADKLFGSYNNMPWQTLNLSESFRLNQPTVDFLNKVLLHTDRIRSSKLSPFKPRYLICDTFAKSSSGPLTELKYYLNLGYEPADIFILAPSVRNLQSPARNLENAIKTKLNLPIFVPASDDDKIDEAVYANKLVFSSYHQVKGLERKVVIIFGFDRTYFEFFKKDKSLYICPNEIYVAVTRNLERLTVIHHFENDYLPFINRLLLPTYADIIKRDKLCPKIRHVKKVDISVTDLTRHLPQDVITECLNFVSMKKIKPKQALIPIDFKSKQKYGYESHSEITGTMIPAYFEYLKNNTMSIYDELIKLLQTEDDLKFLLDKNKSVVQIIDDFIDDDYQSKTETKTQLVSTSETNQDPIYDLMQINLTNKRIDEFLFVSNIWTAFKGGYIYKVDQIINYDWLDQEILNQCITRLNNLGISDLTTFEIKFTATNRPELLERRLSGFVDCLDKYNIYEFKCVNELTSEHFLQVAIYAYLHMVKLEIDNVVLPTHTIYTYKYKQIGKIITVCSNQTYLVQTAKKEMKIKLKTPKNIGQNVVFYTTHIGKVCQTINNKSIDQQSDNLIQMTENITQCQHFITHTDIIDAKLEQLTPKYYLYSILSDELWEISSDLSKLSQMIDYLFKFKFLNKKTVTDSEFFEAQYKIQAKYII